MRRGLLFALATLSCILLAASASAASVSRALLVGCDRFVSQQDTAPSSTNNVRRMAGLLSFADPPMDLVVTSADKVSTVDGLLELIRSTFSEAGSRDVSWLYISTHGLWHEGEPEGSVTLLLSDGVNEEGITADQLRLALDRIPGRKVLLIDACHSGAMLGKGTGSAFLNAFTGNDYRVVCSSGGSEDSWFWASGSDWQQGSGYFSEALAMGAGADGGYAADANRDGTITLEELSRYLSEHHGASVTRVYPEHDGLPLFSYDPEEASGALLTGVTYELGALSGEAPTFGFSYALRRSAPVAYQLTASVGNKWDFANAQLIWEEDNTPGYRERSITLNRDETGDSGYVLLQLLAMENEYLEIISSHVLCVPPEGVSPELSFSGPAAFCPEMRQEFSFAILHDVPCELTVIVEDEQGKTAARLCTRTTTRPERLEPAGSSFTWDGRRLDGSMARAGQYRIRATAFLGGEAWELLSPYFTLEEPGG